MTPKTFAALTVSNLNNGTTTKAVTIQFESQPTADRILPTIGGGMYDVRGGRPSQKRPGRRTVKYVFKGSTHALMRAHVNTLETVDKGKVGLLTYAGGDGFDYSCTAVLRRVMARYLFDNTKQLVVEISLEVDELTNLAKV